MTTLERLRQAHLDRCKTVTVSGVEVGMRPLTVTEAQPLISKFAELAGVSADDPRLLQFYIELIALCAVEPGTTSKALDSDEGRDLIRNLPMGDLFELGFAAAEASGLGGEAAKKN